MFTSLKSIVQDKDSVSFYVRVRPNAPHTKATAVMDDDSIKIDIAAPAEGGKANRELIKFLAHEFSVSQSHVEIVMGEGARQKMVRVRRVGR